MGFVVVNNSPEKIQITSPFGTETTFEPTVTSRVFQGSGGSYRITSGGTIIATIYLSPTGEPIVTQIDQKANLRDITVTRVEY